MEYSSIHQDLVEQCRAGNRQAQFELYRLYSKAMYNICLRMVRNEADAEDILQQSFTQVFTKLDTFNFQSAIGAWIKRIVINNSINFIQSKKMFFQVFDAQLMDVSVQNNPTDDSEQEDFKALSVANIQKAMQLLPDGYRVIFSLYAIEGYDHEEIASIMNISESTSKSQYSRAKQKIRELLKTF